jgi:hypothetical protein
MSCNLKKGGSGGASGFGNCVYGTNQVAGANGAITMNSKCGQMLGGKRKSRRLRTSRRLGGSVIGDVAIPAAFLYANTVYKSKRGKSSKCGKGSKSRRSRRSRR